MSPDKPVAPVELNDKIPVSLSNLVMECCRENPADRPSDMKQLAARLTVVQKMWKKHRESIRAQLGNEGADLTESANKPVKDHE
jgi:hypothetical protein